jgi:F-type H+-transporting ATPase subunit delta
MVKHKKCMDNYLNAMLSQKNDSHKLKLLDEVIAFSNAITGSENSWLFLNSPLMKSSEKKGVIESFAKKLNVEPAVCQFFVLLVKNKRLALTKELLKLCHARKDDIGLVTNMTLVSSHEFSKEQKEHLIKACKTLGFSKINLTTTVDDSLVFGFKLKTNRQCYDMSLNSVFVEFKEEIIRNN